MFVHYGEAVVQRSLWTAFVVEPVRFPARYWNGIWPSTTRADAVFIWVVAYEFSPLSDVEHRRITAQLDIYRGRNREVLSVTHEWSMLSQDSLDEIH